MKSCCQKPPFLRLSPNKCLKTENQRHTGPQSAVCRSPRRTPHISSHQDVTAIAGGQHPSPELLHTPHPAPHLTLGHRLAPLPPVSCGYLLLWPSQCGGRGGGCSGRLSFSQKLGCKGRSNTQASRKTNPFRVSLPQELVKPPCFLRSLNILTDPSSILRLLSLGHQQEDVFKSAGLCVHSEQSLDQG